MRTETNFTQCPYCKELNEYLAEWDKEGGFPKTHTCDNCGKDYLIERKTYTYNETSPIKG